MEKITTSGAALSIAKVNEKALFFIHNVANLQLLRVKIEGPNNTKCEPILSITDTKDVVVEFLPKATGEYVIHIHYNDVAIPSSPFTSKVYDINQIKVKEMPKTIQLDKAATFLVEASNAGPGMLEVIVNNGQVSSTPKALGTALYAITFVPKDLIDHNIQIIFNSEPVPGSPFQLQTVGTSFMRVQKPLNDRISITNPIVFQVKCPANAELGEEMFQIYSPSQKRIKPEITSIESETIKPGQIDEEVTFDVRFKPEEVGDHIIDLKSATDGQSVPGCPFLMKVYDSKKVKITELSDNCVLGRPVYFLIDASKAGAGNLEIIVSVNNGTGSRNVPNYVKSEGNAKFRVNFKPNEAIPHLASVKFNNENVPGSPYTIQISMDNRNEINLPSIVTNLSSLRMCSLSKGIRLVLNKYAIHQALGKIAPHLPANVSPAGFPEVLIHTPANQRQNMELVDMKTEYEGVYLAKEVGPFQIFIYIDKYLINSSQPINCNVYDVSKVKVSGLDTAILGKPFTFQVDASHAGEGTLELVVTTRKCSVKADVLMRSRGLYDVTFLPQSQTVYFVNVTFNDEEVPSNPFKVIIQAPPSNGTLEKLAQLSIAESVDTVDRAYPCSSLEAQKVDALLAQQGVASPVNKPNQPVNAFDPNKIAKGEASTENTTCLVGSINVVYIELGNRLLEQLQLVAKQHPQPVEACVFGPQGNPISSNLAYDLLGNKNSNKLKLDFTPREIGTYRIELINAFNQQSLLNQPISVECCDPSRVRLLDVRDGIVGKQQQFTIDCSKTGSGSLQLSITCKQQQVPFELFEFGPNKTQIKISSLSSNSSSTKINSKSGRFLVKYKPEIDLPHYIDVFYNGHQVAGCPQLISISDPTELLTIMRDSISKSIQLNVDAEMLIEETGSTQGLIEIGEFNCKVFDSDNQPVKNYLHELSDPNRSNKKQYKLQFKPIKIGTHRIEVFYLNNHLTGSPFLTECFDINKVKLQPIQNTNFVVNEKIFLSLDRKDAGYAELDVVVTSPLGRHLPIELTANDQKELICFLPTVQGKYKIAISYGQLTVPGTPITFIANPAPNDQQNGLPKANGESMQIKQQQQKTLTNGHQTNHLNNAAINQQAKKEPENAVQPIILFKQMSGSVNERFMFTIDSNGYKGLPLINIDGPEQEEDLLVEEKNRVFYVSFVPVQVGTYEIKISWSGKEIAKPFKVNIVNLNAVKPKQGWKSLLTNQDTQSIALSLNQPFKATFLTADAGLGSLVGEVILPNGKVQGNIVEHSASNKYKLNFTPKLNGKYLIRLFYSNLLLPQCPLVAITSPQFLLGSNANPALDNQINTQILNGMQKAEGQLNQAPRKLSMHHEVCVSLKGQGLAGARVGQIGQFIIDGSASGPGSPQCTLKLSESDFKYDKSEEDRPVLNVTEIQNKIFRVSYKVKVPGIYILNIVWGNKQVSGCPLKLHITPSCDAGLVEATGAGLKECIVNKPCSIKIDTSKAGPDQLTAHCVGPKKAVMCSLVDELNGIYQLNFTPVETGKHILTIKYGNENIPNSPFTVKVHSQANGSEPDASKVRVYGPGIEHGVLPLFQSRFICETKGAGAGQLTVRIRGPKGAFRVEMARDNTKERSILCKYDPTEPGAYRIEIKWSGEHVPNSPFDVFIFDTQLELNRFLQNGSLGERPLPPLSALGNLPITATGTLPHPHHQTILAPQPISFHKTLPSALAPHPHLIHPIPIGPHYSLPAPPFAGPLNPAFLPINGNEPFFNPYAIPWRGS